MLEQLSGSERYTLQRIAEGKSYDPAESKKLSDQNLVNHHPRKATLTPKGKEQYAIQKRA